MPRKNIPIILTIFMALSLLTTACSGGLINASEAEHAYHMASMDEMPPEVHAAPQVVQTAYQFAAANPEVLTHLPCYCGCGAMGHTSNYTCYVAGENDDGTLIFDNHALGCTICVDITVDAMRLIDEGRSLPEIRTYIDQTYSQFGPTNMP